MHNRGSYEYSHYNYDRDCSRRAGTQQRPFVQSVQTLCRCVTVVDDKIDAKYIENLDAYFATHGIKFTKLVFSGNETVDKMEMI